MSEVDSVLDRNRRLTWGGGGGSAANRPYSRKRNLTSPLLFAGGHRPNTERAGLEMLREEQSGASSDGEASTSSLSTSSAAEVEVRGHAEVRGRADLQLPSAAKGPGNTGRSWSMGIGGEGVASIERWRSRHHSHGGAMKSGDHPTQMLDSLHTINSQLGELLDRVGAPARMSMPAAIPYGQQQPYIRSEESTLASSNARYFSQYNELPLILDLIRGVVSF